MHIKNKNKFSGGGSSAYKEKIIEMVEKIENPATLKFILAVIESYLKSRGV